MASNKRTIYLGLDYASFSGGITEINRKMGLLDAEFKLAQQQAKNYGNETDQTGVKIDYLSQKIQLQNQKVEEAKKAYDNALASNKASQKEIDALDKKLLTERAALENLNGQLQQTQKDTDNVSSATKSMGEVMNQVKEAVMSLYTKMMDLSTSYAEACDNLMTLSAQTGLTTTELQELQYAAKFLDVSVETMAGSLTKLERSMYSARNGTGEAAEAFKKLHIRVTDGRGQLRDANEVFDEAIDKLGEMSNETERDALAMQIFGRSAKELNPLIKAGSEELEKYKNEAHENAVIMSGEMVEGGQRLHDAMDRLTSIWEAARMALAAGLAPILETVADTLSKMNPTALAIAAVFGSLAVTVVKVASALKIMSLATAMQTTAQGALNIVSSKFVIITVAILAALAAVAVIIGMITGKADDMSAKMEQTAKTTSKISTNITDSMNGYAQRTNSVGRNASGTSYWEGGATWVGEEGPELVNLPRGSRITPASETYNNAVNNYYITIDAKNVHDFNRVVELAQQQQMALRRT